MTGLARWRSRRSLQGRAANARRDGRSAATGDGCGKCCAGRTRTHATSARTGRMRAGGLWPSHSASTQGARRTALPGVQAGRGTDTRRAGQRGAQVTHAQGFAPTQSSMQAKACSCAWHRGMLASVACGCAAYTGRSSAGTGAPAFPGTVCATTPARPGAGVERIATPPPRGMIGAASRMAQRVARGAASRLDGGPERVLRGAPPYAGNRGRNWWVVSAGWSY